MHICKYTKYANKPYFESRSFSYLILHPLYAFVWAGYSKKHQLLRFSWVDYGTFLLLRFRTHS